jgi:hypothetical protein
MGRDEFKSLSYRAPEPVIMILHPPIDPYSIFTLADLSPAIAGTGSPYELVSSKGWTQWIMRDGVPLEPPTDPPIERPPIEHRARLSVHSPVIPTQKTIRLIQNLRRDLAINRPTELTQAGLSRYGYDTRSPEDAPENQAALEAVAIEHQPQMLKFQTQRDELNLAIVDLVYPAAEFSVWYKMDTENPITWETLLGFAASQADAFLGDSPGLLTGSLLPIETPASS